MKNFAFFALFTIATFSFSSCNINCVEGTGNVVTKNIQLDKIKSLELSSSIPVTIAQGQEQMVQIKGYENIVELLNKKVKRGAWEIKFDKCLASSDNVEIHITLPALEKIALNGSGSISTEGVFKSEILELALDGSGKMKLELQVKELETNLSGSGDINLEGSTKIHDISLNGSGDINAENLKSDNVSIDLSGSGDVRVFSSYKLNITVDGSGDVYYKGNVKSISSDINGSGNLHQISN